MRHPISTALLWVARLILPSRGKRRRPLPVACVSTTLVPAVPDQTVICAPTKPIPILELELTLLTVTPRRGFVPAHVAAWEQKPAAERQAILEQNAAAEWDRWLRTEARERARRDTPAARRARRAAAFALAMDLPDPHHWLDTIITGVPHTLAGAVA